MKKIFLSGLLFLGVLTEIKSQVSESEEPGAIRKGNSSINLYYGTNVLGAVYARLITAVSESAVNVTSKSTGPVGLVYEYLINDDIGLGAEFGYSQTKINFNYGEANFQNNQVVNLYEYSYTFTTIRAMFRANYHFLKHEKFDVYGLVSLGLRFTNIKVESNDPLLQFSYEYRGIPVGLKPGMGFRYFFVPNFGLNIELALGAPFACGGLSFKF